MGARCRSASGRKLRTSSPLFATFRNRSQAGIAVTTAKQHRSGRDGWPSGRWGLASLAVGRPAEWQAASGAHAIQAGVRTKAQAATRNALQNGVQTSVRNALTVARTSVWVLVFLAVWLSAAGVSRAEKVWSNGANGVRAGLKWELSGNGALGAGYLPLQITLETLPAGPSPVERRIRFELVLERNGTRDLFSREIVLPSGSASVTAMLPITLGKGCYWNSSQVNCYEDGRLVRDLSVTMPVTIQAPNYGEPELFASLLFIDRDAPPVQRRQEMVNRLLALTEPAPSVLPRFLPLTSRLSGEAGGARLNLNAVTYNQTSLTLMAASQSRPTSFNDADLLSTMDKLSNVGLVAPADLPEDWLALSNYDIVFIPWPEMRDLAQAAGKQYSALRAWVSAGGVLCVHGVGKRFAAQRALESALQLSTLPAEAPASRSHVADFPNAAYATDPTSPANAGDAAKASQPKSPPSPVRMSDSGWSEVGRLAKLMSLPIYQEDPNMAMMGYQQRANHWNDSAATLPRPLALAPRTEFEARYRELGLGVVVALDTQDPWEAPVDRWAAVFGSVGEAQFRPLQRLGVARLAANPDFGTFVVPGVGEPPIVLFLLLITVFAILLGPVNYYILRSRKRLQWMYLTVPAAAFLATVGLLGYAVLADGLGVRSRIASVTHVDQLAGVSSSHSRQAYFAGLNPRGGLRFPLDAMVQPIDHESEFHKRRGQLETRAVEWADQQAFTTGYMASRTMNEWLVVAAQPATIGLRIQLAADGSGACRVRNELGVGLHTLVICDEQGRLYFTTRLPAGGDVKLEEQDWSKFESQLFDALPPRIPALTAWTPQRTNMWFGWSPQFMVGSFEPSIINASHRQITLRRPFEARRGYLATAEQPLAVPLGITPDEVVHDLHVVIGAW